jgi:hypothetical protein
MGNISVNIVTKKGFFVVMPKMVVIGSMVVVMVVVVLVEEDTGVIDDNDAVGEDSSQRIPVRKFFFNFKYLSIIYQFFKFII